MKIPKITLKEAEKVVKEHSFKIDKNGHYSKKRIKKADKFEKKHGFRYEDVWDLDNVIACFVLPRLVRLRDVHYGVPQAFFKDNESEFKGLTVKEADKKWTETLNKIIYAFYLYITKESYEWQGEEEKIVEEGLDLFRTHFGALWD